MKYVVLSALTLMVAALGPCSGTVTGARWSNGDTTAALASGEWNLQGNTLDFQGGAMNIDSNTPFNGVEVKVFKDLNKSGHLDEGDEIIGTLYTYSGPPRSHLEIEAGSLSFSDSNCDPSDNGRNNRYSIETTVHLVGEAPIVCVVTPNCK